MLHKKIAACLVLCAVCGCGGGGARVARAPSALPSPSLSLRSSASFTITIPARTTSAISRAPRYVSSATQSVVITLVSVNGTPFTSSPAVVARNLTSSDPACSGVPLTCTVVAPAAVGDDLFNVVTYDAVQTSVSPTSPQGHALSQASVSVNVVVNQANVAPPLVLNGIAASLAFTGPSGDPHVLGTQSTGYQIIGNQPYVFTVTARDAAGNVIIDPGAPSFNVQSGSNALVISPVSGTVNAYAVRARRFSAIPVLVTIAASTGITAANVAFSTIQELWVANAYDSTITAYAGQPPVQIASDTITRSSGILGPEAIAFDDYGRMWVANFANVTMFAGSTAAPAATITAGLTTPTALAFDSGGTLWVANIDSGSGSVVSYAGTSQLPNTITNPGNSITGLWGPRGLAFDSAGNLWVANGGGNVQTVTAYAGTTQITGTTITGVGAPWGLAFDGSGALWVASGYPASTVNPYRGSTIVYGNTITAGLNQPAGIAFDASGNLWVANSSTGVGGSAITEYSGGSQVAANTITTGNSGPAGLTFAPPAALPVNPPPPHPSPPPAPVIANPSSVAFSQVGSGFVFVRVSQAGYFGDYSMTNSNPSVASAEQVGTSTTVRPLSNGTTTLHITGGFGQSVDVSVTVQTGGTVVVSPSTLAFTNVGPAFSQTVALSQAHASGQFGFLIFDPTVVSASITGGTLTVTPLKSGSTVVRVGGDNFQFADVSVGVTISNVNIHGARRGAR
jgi:sugar lactone lactonase YvrE